MNWSRREWVRNCAGLCLGAAFDARSQQQPRSGFVKTSGKNLVTPVGEKLRLRGINLGNWFEPEGYMFLFEGGPQSPREIEAFFNELIGPSAAADFWKEYRRRYITEKDIQFIHRSGLNSVRIPLHYKYFQPGSGGFEVLDPVIGWCRQAGIWVLLDMHCAPGGQTGTNIDDSWGYPWLYESDRNQELTCAVWKHIAGHYRDEPIVLGYDLLNEPIPHYPRLRQYNPKLEPLLRRITAAIREVDSNHAIFLEAAQWDSNFEVFGPPFDHNLVYEFHKYWTAPTQAVIQQYLDYRDRYNVPIWLGESGENKDEWIEQFVKVLERNDIGWCFWPYKKMEKTSCMVSIPKPVHWDDITKFAAMPTGTGNAEKRIAARPSLDHSREAANDLLDKISLAKCRVNTGYLQALGLRT
ncbi:MAG: cellulase family glycosylhydrolase [Acidobacteriaceae bacterium]|nr:cellulase family glycosylhydrolase [Acidobacteriaceae bacterium]